MVQVRVAGVALDASGQHVLLLKPVDQIPGDGLVLPIWIGQLEATSILVAVENAEVPRPLAHDLMGLILAALGERVVDARPSDAVALASRVGAPIWVADAVLTEAGVPDVLTETDAAERLDEFKRFLDDVEPEDFES